MEAITSLPACRGGCGVLSAQHPFPAGKLSPHSGIPCGLGVHLSECLTLPLARVWVCHPDLTHHRGKGCVHQDQSEQRSVRDWPQPYPPTFTPLPSDFAVSPSHKPFGYGWPQLRSRLPFGPRSQASLQKAQGPGVCKLPKPPASRALCQAKRAPRASHCV